MPTPLRIQPLPNPLDRPPPPSTARALEELERARAWVKGAPLDAVLKAIEAPAPGLAGEIRSDVAQTFLKEHYPQNYRLWEASQPPPKVMGASDHRDARLHETERMYRAAYARRIPNPTAEQTRRFEEGLAIILKNMGEELLQKEYQRGLPLAGRIQLTPRAEPQLAFSLSSGRLPAKNHQDHPRHGR